MLGADFYETDSERAALLAEGRVPIGIGENTKIKYNLQLNILLCFNHFSFTVVPHCSTHVSTETALLTKMPESERMLS